MVYITFYFLRQSLTIYPRLAPKSQFHTIHSTSVSHVLEFQAYIKTPGANSEVYASGVT